MIFRTGDIVVMQIDDRMKLKGKIARVLRVEPYNIQIEFFDHINGHSCAQTGKDGHCWNVHPGKLTLLNKDDLGLTPIQRKINRLWSQQNYTRNKPLTTSI